MAAPGGLKDAYDIVIIGGGSHGLAAAYYLASAGSPTWRCSSGATSAPGAAGRNTTILRSNYKTPEGARFYDASVKLYEDCRASFTSTCCSPSAGTSRSRTPTARCR